MSTLLADSDRNIVPRWRDYLTTAHTRELDFPGAPPPQPPIAEEFIQHRQTAWSQDPTIENATELVLLAFVLHRFDLALAPAHFLLMEDIQATPQVKRIAGLVLAPERLDDDNCGQPVTEPIPNVDDERARIHVLKLSLSSFPHNPILWADLSRSYALLGQTRQSVHAMSAALSLAPMNRFVLRSAVRLFVHFQEPDRAHYLLTSGSMTNHDPWLVASDIAVSTLLQRTSPFIRKAREFISSGTFSPFHLSELSSALATLDFRNGTSRKTRKLFKASLEDPTDNAVAQAAWAARRLSGFEVPPDALRVPRSFEARAWASFSQGNWHDSMQNASQWLCDEPFSSRPAEFGSYVADVALEDYSLSEGFARRGLISNPGELPLLNNLVFSLANEGKLDEAEDLLQSATEADPKDPVVSALMATNGLIRFRRGDLQSGRDLYSRAMTQLGDARLQKQRALAAIYLAREEIRADTSRKADALEQAKEFASGVPDREVSLLLSRLTEN